MSESGWVLPTNPLPPEHVYGRREPKCPCPVEPCGAVSSDKVDPTCEVHHLTDMTTRYGQTHWAGSPACTRAAERAAQG